MHIRKTMTEAQVEAAARRVAIRRRRNPIRDARRQSHLTRALRRVVDFIPKYADIWKNGEVVGRRYRGHVAIYAVRGAR